MTGQRSLTGRTATIMLVVFAATTACESPEPAADAGVDAGLETTTDGPESAGIPEVTGQGFAAGFDPCELISPEEAARASGQAVGSPQHETYDILATCAYPAQDGMMPAVILEARPDDSLFETAREMLESGPGSVEELDGIGDRAFYGVMAGYHTVTLAASGRFAVVSVTRDPESDNKQRALDLARQVAGRL